jgi:hypothetical protein
MMNSAGFNPTAAESRGRGQRPLNEPLALWTFEPKTLQHRIRDAQTNSGSMSTTNRLTIIFRFVGVVKKMRVFHKSQMQIDLL